MGVLVIFFDIGYYFVEIIGIRDVIEFVYDVWVFNVILEYIVVE